MAAALVAGGARARSAGGQRRQHQVAAAAPPVRLDGPAQAPVLVPELPPSAGVAAWAACAGLGPPALRWHGHGRLGPRRIRVDLRIDRRRCLVAFAWQVAPASGALRTTGAAVPMGGRQMCEACGTKHASYGTPAERKRRWCGRCGKTHGAICLNAQTMCETCGATWPSCGTPTERKARWCAGCGKAHGAISLSKKQLPAEATDADGAAAGAPVEEGPAMQLPAEATSADGAAPGALGEEGEPTMQPPPEEEEEPPAEAATAADGAAPGAPPPLARLVAPQAVAPRPAKRPWWSLAPRAQPTPEADECWVQCHLCDRWRSHPPTMAG
eukprot:COSAG06_NODE_6674_length_2830_cov_6.665324_3_plen_326_part_01